MADLLILHGGHVIDPASGLDGPADIVLSGGVIEDVLSGHDHTWPAGTQVLDARGMVVAPGFIDLHCHLRVPGQEHKETIASGTRAAARGGFTTVCCMPNTRPSLDSERVVVALQERIAAEAVVDVRIIGAISIGQEGRLLVDMPGLARAGVVAFSDDGKPVQDATLLRHALHAAAALSLPLTLHEEDPLMAGSGALHAGPTALALGLPGIPAGAEEAMVARDLALLADLVEQDDRQLGLHLHVAHASTAGTVELIRRAKERGLPVTAEVTPHHLTLTDNLAARPRHGQAYDTSTKVNPPLRSAADVQTLREAIRQGIVDVIATDHAPHALEDKDCAYTEAAFGISNFETALASNLTLVHDGVLSLAELISRMVTRPAEVFRLFDGGRLLGRLERGGRADVVVFAPDEVWQVRATAFCSRGRNTPLDGATVRGRVHLTIAGGRIVYQRETGTSGLEQSGTL